MPNGMPNVEFGPQTNFLNKTYFKAYYSLGQVPNVNQWGEKQIKRKTPKT